MSKLPEKALHKYADYMREIKSRTDVIRRVLVAHDAGDSLTGYRESDLELCFLQFRKCLELVMFASLVAHYHSGVALERKVAEKEWNAGRAMAYLSKVNPRFYPKALDTESRGPDGVREAVAVEGALTRTEFSTLYDRVCGPYLHASRQPAFAEKHELLFEQVRSWLNKLRLLLNSHWVTVTSEWEFAVLMHADTTGDVQVVLFKKELEK